MGQEIRTIMDGISNKFICIQASKLPWRTIPVGKWGGDAELTEQLRIETAVYALLAVNSMGLNGPAVCTRDIYKWLGYTRISRGTKIEAQISAAIESVTDSISGLRAKPCDTFTYTLKEANVDMKKAHVRVNDDEIIALSKLAWKSDGYKLQELLAIFLAVKSRMMLEYKYITILDDKGKAKKQRQSGYGGQVSIEDIAAYSGLCQATVGIWLRAFAQKGILYSRQKTMYLPTYYATINDEWIFQKINSRIAESPFYKKAMGECEADLCGWYSINGQSSIFKDDVKHRQKKGRQGASDLRRIAREAEELKEKEAAAEQGQEPEIPFVV